MNKIYNSSWLKKKIILIVSILAKLYKSWFYYNIINFSVTRIIIKLIYTNNKF